MSQEVDLDRLADYAAGLLDEPDAAEVARLVDTDPRWATVHAALAEADATVRAELRELARAHPEPMPADVVARLDAGFSSDAFPGDAFSSAATPHGTDDGRTADVVPLAARRRRKQMFARTLAAAAAVIAVVGGFSVLADTMRANDLPSSTSQDAASGDFGNDAGSPERPPAAPSGVAPGAAEGQGPIFLASGTDYQADTLARLVSTRSSMAAQDPQVTSADQPPAAVPGPLQQRVQQPLARLTDPMALAACLRAILTRHPGTVTVLDFARYRGEPALVVLVRGAQQSIVVAVGAGCGSVGPAELGSASVD